MVQTPKKCTIVKLVTDKSLLLSQKKLMIVYIYSHTITAQLMVMVSHQKLLTLGHLRERLAPSGMEKE